MINTQSNNDNNKDIRIAKRIYILSNIENIISESSYYRTHSPNFKYEKTIIGNIKEDDFKVKII